MLKFTAKTGEGRTFVGLGITPENVAKLVAGDPIHVDLAAAPPEGVGLEGGPIVAVIFGASVPALLADLQAAGIALPMPPVE